MNIFTLKKFFGKKTIILTSLLLVVLAVGIVNNKLSEKDSIESAEYADYERQMIDEHDGEVLVDSANIGSLPGKDPENNESSMENASVITSDDLADLSADSYFAEIRATIDMDRNEILSMLTSVISESTSNPEKDNATQQKLKIIEYMNAEKIMESLIENKGFVDSFVVMTDTSVNVTVNKDELTQSDVAKIYDVVMRETGRPSDQIVVQNKQ